MELPYIIANWKMNKSVEEACTFAMQLEDSLQNREKKATIVLCPPYIALPHMAKMLHTKYMLGVQNFYPQDSGNITGEISLAMLQDEMPCAYAIVGHSERRILLKEDDDFITKKVHYALEKGYSVVFCVGESLEEKESGLTEQKIQQQLDSLSNIRIQKNTKILIAYEPIWAIGTGLIPTREYIAVVVEIIQKYVAKTLAYCSKNVYTLYGGSVTQYTVKEILSIKGVHGVLVGGASLQIDSFLQIIENS